MTRTALVRRTRLNLQSLEGRETPAGVVNASLAGGVLTLTGDDFDNGLQLQQTAAGIEVTGTNGTIVNGGPVFAGVTALNAVLADGNDDLRLTLTTNLVLTGTATFNLGDGDNTLQLLTIGRIGLAGLSVVAGDGKDTITVAGGFGQGSQITGNASVAVGVGRGDQDDVFGARTHVSVRAMDVLGAGGLRLSGLDGDEEFVVQGVNVRTALNVNGGEGATELHSVGGRYGSALLTSVGFARGAPLHSLSVIMDGTTVTGAVNMSTRYGGVVMDWTDTTTGPVTAATGPLGHVGADFNGTSVIRGNLTVRGDRLSFGPEAGATLTVQGDVLATATDHVTLHNSRATLSARNITLTGTSSANYQAFDDTSAGRLNASGAVTLRGRLVQWDQTGGEVTIGGRLAMFGTTEAAFRTGVGFSFNDAPAKTSAASFLLQARQASFEQTESEATFPGGLSVIGSEDAFFLTQPRSQNEDPANPGTFDSADGARTTVANGNLLVQSTLDAGYFQIEGVATYAGLSVVGGRATVETDVGDGLNSVGGILSVTARPAVIRGTIGEYHQEGGESTFAAGLSIQGRVGESQFRTDTGETRNENGDFIDLPARFVVTAGPLSLNAGPADVMFSAGGGSVQVGGDLSITGAGFNRIWLDPEDGTTVGGSLRVLGGTADPDWFLVRDDLTVGKDLSVNLGGGVNDFEFGLAAGATTVGGNFTVTGGNASDELILHRVTVAGTTTLNTNAAADTIVIGNGTTFNGQVSINTGGGADVLRIADQPGAAAPVTFNAPATVQMGIGNDDLRLGLALLAGGDLNSRVAFGPAGSLRVDGGANLNTFDDEAGQFDVTRVTVLNFVDPTP